MLATGRSRARVRAPWEAAGGAKGGVRRRGCVTGHEREMGGSGMGDRAREKGSRREEGVERGSPGDGARRERGIEREMVSVNARVRSVRWAWGKWALEVGPMLLLVGDPRWAGLALPLSF